jgi:hypothetical protein
LEIWVVVQQLALPPLGLPQLPPLAGWELLAVQQLALPPLLGSEI